MDNTQGNLRSLQQEFPDMTQSVLGDVLQVYQGNKQAASAALVGIKNETQRENDKKLMELRELFPLASEKLCKEILVSTNWDVELAILPMFNKIEEAKQQTRKEKEQELIKKKRS